MAFKRSAVRSRLSPPLSTENTLFSVLFLYLSGGFASFLGVFETRLGNEYLRKYSYQNNTRITLFHLDQYVHYIQTDFPKMPPRTSQWLLASVALEGADNGPSYQYPHVRPCFGLSLRSLQGPAFDLHRYADSSAASTYEPLRYPPAPF